jgi:plasmid stabilization system protein ParE
MTNVQWTLQAQSDLAGIHEYVSRDSVRYADFVAAELVAAVGRLKAFPESGRHVPERQDPMLREVLWRSYRIVYRYFPESKEAHILLVFRAERMYPGTGGA